MAEDRREKLHGLKTRSLPKNFRQIGEPGAKKIYIEDYVYTYLNKLAGPENLYARGAILFGSVLRTPIGNGLFINGAAACQNFELDLDETVFSEESWNEIYRIRDKFFPEREIVGWFLSRMGFSTDLNDKIIRIHMDNFSGENKVLYMMDALENEDAFYQFENYSLKKQRGYYIYYESNQEMKNYMLAEGEADKIPEPVRRSGTIRRDAAVVKNYRKALNKKKKLTAHRHLLPSYAGGALFAALLILCGIYTVRNYQKNEKAQTVFSPQENIPAERTTEQMPDQGMNQESSQKSEEQGTAQGTGQETNQGTEQTTGRMTEQGTGQMTDRTSDQTAGQETEQGTGQETGQGTNQTGGQTSGQAADQGDEEPEETSAQESWSEIGGYYTVKKGDTLAGISQKIYQSYDYIEALAEANNIENIDQIYPGQILEIPQIED